MQGILKYKIFCRALIHQLNAKTMNEKTKTLLKASYLMLQRLSNESVRVGIETDGLRASLRNHISELDGVDTQELQEEVERMALINPIKS